jgi:hypothetical protein
MFDEERNLSLLLTCFPYFLLNHLTTSFSQSKVKNNKTKKEEGGKQENKNKNKILRNSFSSCQNSELRRK